MKLTELLDQIDRLDKAATNGPWHVAPEEDEDGSKFPWAIFGPKNDLWGAQGWDHEHYIQEIPELTIPDAEFIALARTALPALSRAVRAVLELHKTRVHDEDPTSPFCNFCGPGTPCETTRAITDAMGADDD